MTTSRLTSATLQAAVALWLTLTSEPRAQETNRFGFTGPEIFPIENQIAQLRGGDVDGDGLNDLVLVNNARSRITILRNQTGKTNAPPTPLKRRLELNELPPDARFRVDSIASEKRIASLLLADLNGDRRPDLAFFGDPSPKELVVLYNLETNGWSAPKRWPLDDGLMDPNALTCGDLNGDGLTDVLLVAEGHIYMLEQKPDHSLGEPEKIPYWDKIRTAQVVDIDGDRRDDLLLVNWDGINPVRVRFQNGLGHLGPEAFFPMAPIRSYCAEDLEDDGRTELVTIAMKSGRAQVASFVRKPAENLSGGFRKGQFQVMPLSKTSKAQRGVVWADVNSDGRTDLLVSEPESGQLTVYLQQNDGKLAPPKVFPAFTGVTELCVTDWDGDTIPEIFLLSIDERQIGVTHYDKSGRIAFPTVLPVGGKPLAMTTAPAKSGAAPSLFVVVDVEGRRELQTRSADGRRQSQKLSESFKSNPSRVAAQDLTSDGLADLVILTPYEKIKVLVQVPEKPFDEQDIAPPGGSVEQPWMSLADVNADGQQELLLAQKNFVRAVHLESEKQPGTADEKTPWTFKVDEQINGAASNSRIVGAVAVTGGAKAPDFLFLMDAERKCLTLCNRDSSGVWQVANNVPLPATDFHSLVPLRLGGDRINAVGMVGINAVGWLPLEGDCWETEELDGYETPIKDGFLNDVVVGDLNQDRRKDLVFFETARNYLDIVTYEPPHELKPANRWQVFEERSFRGRRAESPEPREGLILDLTGDGKNDLAIIVHDRVLLYPQE